MTDLSRFSQYLQRRYAYYYCKTHKWNGQVFQRMYKSIPIGEDAYLLGCGRYIERNPVRAGLVRRAEDYLWSSAAAHCGLRDDVLLSGNCPLLLQITDWSEWLKIDSDDEVRTAIRRHTATGRPLGSREFLMRIGAQIGQDMLPKKRGRPLKRKQSDAGSNN